MFYVQAYIMHFCVCHESSLTVGIDLIYYQCSGVVDGTRYIMPNTTFRILVICKISQIRSTCKMLKNKLPANVSENTEHFYYTKIIRKPELFGM